MNPGFIQKLQNGLLGPVDTYGGILSDADAQAARNAGLMNLGASLLAASGPSTTPIGTGQAIGQAVMQGTGAQSQSIQEALNNALLKKQLLTPAPRKVSTLAAGGKLVDENTGQVIADNPESNPYKPQDPLAQLESDRRQGLVSDQDYQARRALLVSRAAPVQVNVSTEKKFGEALAGKMADQYSAQYEAAQNAKDAIASAQRVRDLLKTIPYTGTGAEYKLAFGKAAKAAGFDYGGDDISNTELLAKELGQNVLNNVKSSGLAGSQGLTEGERKFLLQVVGGTITLDDKTLARIADLNERTARNSIKKWNSTAGKLDQATLQTLGMGPVDDAQPSNSGWSIEPAK